MSTRIFAACFMVFLLCAFVGSAVAKVLHVPDDFRTIQDAMREARHGDEVLVGPGTYEGPLDVKNGVILRSAEGPEVTTLRGHRWWVVRLADADTLTALIGFTVDGRRAADRVVYCSGGGSPRVLDNVIQRGWDGIACEGSSAIIRNNVLRKNHQGISCKQSSPLVLRNRITDNGKGVLLTDSAARLENNVIDLNRTGIYVEEYSLPVIGGALEKANDIFDNMAFNLENHSKIKSEGIRTLVPALLVAEYNYWGSDCPLARKFKGSVDYKPWVDKKHRKKLTSCP